MLARQQNDEGSANPESASTPLGRDFLSFQSILRWPVRCLGDHVEEVEAQH
jgi:hypothetical protein